MNWTTLSFLTFLLVAVISTTNVFAHLLFLSKPLDVKGTLELVPRDYRDLYSGIGVVKTARQCGGQGKFLQWRRETCEFTIQGLCVHPPNVYTRGEVSFVPLESSDGLGVRGKVLDVNGGEIYTFDIPNMTNGTVNGGKEYTSQAKLSFGEALRGQLIKGILEFYRPSDKKLEVCAEAEFLVA